MILFLQGCVVWLISTCTSMILKIPRGLNIKNLGIEPGFTQSKTECFRQLNYSTTTSIASNLFCNNIFGISSMVYIKLGQTKVIFSTDWFSTTCKNEGGAEEREKKDKLIKMFLFREPGAMLALIKALVTGLFWRKMLIWNVTDGVCLGLN